MVEPKATLSSPKHSQHSSPDQLGAISMNESPKRKSAMASIIISGTVVMDDESSVSKIEKGV